MTHLCFGLVCALLGFSILGLGPSLFLTSRRNLGFSFALAPTIGFVIVAVFGTYLTLLDIPVERWTLPFFVAGAALSVLLVILRSIRAPVTSASGGRRATVWGLGGFVITFALAVSPQLFGGLDYSVLRGNGTDSFNYITAADYLDHEPFSWAEHVDRQTLINRNQGYERARELLTTRWSTMMLLAFTSNIAQTPIYIFDYAFSLLCLLLGYGPAFLYSRSMKLSSSLSAITASAICLGFWAQLILDTRAESQLSSIPVLLFLMFLISHIENRTEEVVQSGTYAILAATFVSLSFLYVEIVPMALLALIIYLLTRIRSNRLNWIAIRSYDLTVLLSALGLLPAWPLLSRFIVSQFAYASTGANNWHLVYYTWLYSNPLAGFWGFGPLESDGNIFATAGSIFVTMLGVFLTVLLLIALCNSLARGGVPVRLAACVFVAAAAEFAYLAVRGQLWAAAKGLSFGYAFFILCVAGYCFGAQESLTLNRIPWWPKAARALALIFLVSENALGLVHSEMAMHKRDYPHYISHHGEYRHHIWDLTAFEKVLDRQSGVTVWMDLSNGWLADYVSFAIGHQVKLINIGSNLAVDQLGMMPQERSQAPQYIITDRLSAGMAVGNAASVVLASNSEMALIRSGAGGVSLVSVKNPNGNPNGVESGRNGNFFWIGGEKPTVFTVLAPSNTCASFTASVTMGPSSTLDFRTVVVQNPKGEQLQRLVVHDGAMTWQAPVRDGINEIGLVVQEKQDINLPSDSRPLMLHMESVKVDGVACEGQTRKVTAP